MQKIFKVIKAVADKIIMRRYWIFASQDILIKKEVEKNKDKWDNESVFMRHMINQWFKK